jgi:phage/plasmid primase-like uncharacterized protein
MQNDSRLENFRAAMRAAGLEFDGQLVADGKLHRFKSSDDQNRDSWFVLFPASSNTPAAGGFGCWKRGVKETWCEKRRESLTDAEWRTIREGWKLADDERQRTEAERHTKARKIAAWIFGRAMPVTIHPYLTAKGAKVSGDVREHRGALVLPLRDTGGELHSLQFIGADGTKRFLSGGRIAGCYFTLADKPESPLAICEGFATGASIHEATGFAVVCAMNCGNLLAVSKALREKFPAREIIVCADNDQFTDGNPGVLKATEAAKTINAKLAVPKFADASKKPTDFNDMAAIAGLAEVKRQIESAAIIETSVPIAGATMPRASASPEIIVLPSGAVSISESARVIFQRIAPMRTLFWRGGVLVELVEVDCVQGLDVLKPEKFRSDVEKIGQLYAYRAAGKGEPALKPAKMSLDDAKAILAASESREFLPSIASVLRCPVLTESKTGGVDILGKGYHAELGGLLIVDGDTPPRVPLAEAVASLRWLVEEFDFQTESDRSRALAAFVTPALRLGGFFIRENIPIDCAEADKSQAGKGHRHEMVWTLYNEKSYFVTDKSGGVGSVDESFAAALVAARPFICLDNFRGRMDSRKLESFLTCPTLFPSRTPGKQEALIDPKKFILQISSNGLESTIDLANRASICRIRKRPGFQYRDTLGELQRRQPFFLGCVFAVIGEWIASGKPRSQDTRHDFRAWSQTLDWIVQNVLGCAPLMDGHQAAQERTSNPALSFMRAVALAVAGENRLGVALIASEMVEICELHAIKIPGEPADTDKAKRQVGCLCKQVFRESDTVNVDGFTVTRADKAYRKPSGDWDTTNSYTFTK